MAFNDLFWPITVVMVGSVIYKILQVFFSEQTLVTFQIKSLHVLIVQSLWGFFLWKCKHLSKPEYFLYASLLGACVLINVQAFYLDSMPAFLNNIKQPTPHEQILRAMIYASIFNYSSFTQTIILLPIIVLPNAYVALEIEKGRYFDINTGELLSDESRYPGDQFREFILLTFAFCAGHYLKQRNLLVVTIDKVTIQR